MANRSVFPSAVDEWIEHQEISASDKPLIQRYQVLMLKESLTPTESDELASLTTRLRDKIQTAEDFNKLQDAITNVQTFFRDEVDGYVKDKQNEMESFGNTKQNEMEDYVDTKKDEVETFVNTKKSDMEDHHRQKVDELDSLVQRTEANVIIQESEPTNGLYDGLMWYQPSTTDTKVYLAGEFREIGGGGGSLERYVNRVKIDVESDRVDIGIINFDKARDILLVYQNSTYIKEGTDYRINVDSSRIIKLNGTWNKDTEFDFIVLTSVPSRDTLNNAKFSSVYEIVNESEQKIPIRIPEFNSNTDILDVYDEGILLIEGTHYDLSASGTDVELKYVPSLGHKIHFSVFKKVRLELDPKSTDGALLMSNSITNDKLHQDIKVGSLSELSTENKDSVVSAINEVNAKEVDLTPIESQLQDVGNKINGHLADVAELRDDLDEHVADETAHGIGDKSQLETTEKSTIVGAVNELFTNVSNGKSLVGGAITDVDPNVVIPTDPTFQQLADSIGQISTGKKWAEGTITLGPSTIVVNNVGFTPSTVLVYSDTNIFSAVSSIGGGANSVLSTTHTKRYYRSNNVPYDSFYLKIIEGGFETYANASGNANWIAFE